MTGQDKALTSSHENQKKIINTILLHVNLHMWKSNYGASIICDHIKKKKQLSKLIWNNKWDRYSWFCLFNYLLHYTYSWLGGLLIAQPSGWACQWMGKAVRYGRVWSAYIYKIHQQDRVNGHTCLRTIFASFQLATIFYHLAVSSIVWGKFIGMMQWKPKEQSRSVSGELSPTLA